MRILLASCIPRSETTGMGKWTIRMANALGARGHEVECVWASDLGGSRSIDRHLFGWRLSRHLASMPAPPDVAVIHEPSAASSCVRARLSGGGPAIAVMSHGVESRILVELENADKLGSSVRALRHAVLWGWRERLAFRLAHHVFCLSNVDAEYLRRHCGVQAERLTKFGNGTDGTDQQVDVSGATDVLFLGSWIPEKGARILPQIWRKVRAFHPGARLVLAGTGCEREAVLTSFAPEDHVSISVIPTFQRLEEIWPALKGCALYVLPSLREGSPLALLETMVRGLPSVAASVGGVPELLDHGREGYLYHPLDIEAASQWIMRLLSDPGHRSILGRAARERALRSTWGVAAEAMDRGCLAAISRNSDAGHDTLRTVDSRSRSGGDPNLRRGA